MEYYDIGLIVSTHGLNGEVKVKVITDFPELRFKKGSTVFLKKGEKMLTVAAGRPFQQFWLVKFAEISDIDQAKVLKGNMLQVSANDQQKLPAGSYYYHDILGLQVIDARSGQVIGKISDIESPGANDIWQVQETDGKNFWLPYIPSVVKKIDLSKKQILVSLMKGLRNED